MSMVLRPTEPNGIRATGEIAKLLVGQGYGYIRLPDNREVYFHRADLQDGTSFNDLRVGDSVAFGLLDDRISGARAVKVRLQKRAR